jgi:hypothetical protein
MLVKKVQLKDQNAPMPTGQYALRAINNVSTPGIDLLVREAIQNSLDAALPGVNSVPVEFKFQQFSVDALHGIIDDQTVTKLQAIHPTNTTSLYIRDSNTCGLSGPTLRRNLVQGEDSGNYLKLCFSIGEPQNQEQAGGSWGIGKTVFFRSCHSPVMLYSRFLDGETFKERLLFYLIENADLNDAFTATSSGPASTGFAWWGASLDGQDVLPCEDPNQITSILERIGGLPRFLDSETGTLIFLPCLRDGQIPTSSEQGSPYWIPRGQVSTREFENYTNVSIQRWYAPRLNNPYFCREGQRSPYLTAKVGDHAIGDASRFPILPITDVFQKLYNVASGICTPTAKILCEEVSLRQTFNGQFEAGKVAAMRISCDDPILKMQPPDNYPDPLVQAGESFAGLNQTTPPLVAMTRKPGMIVAYNSHGDWVQGIKPDPDGFYLLALFVLRSEAQMASDYKNRSLDEEIRQNEPPAHDCWKSGIGLGGRNLRLVERIIAGVKRAINSRFYPENHPSALNQAVASLAHDAAVRLLPPGFGGGVPSDLPKKAIWTCPNHPEIRKREPGNCPMCDSTLVVKTAPPQSKGNEPSISFNHQTFTDNGKIEIEVEVYNGTASKVEILLNVATEGSHFGLKEWLNDIEKPFPFEFESAKICKYSNGEGKGRARTSQVLDVLCLPGNINKNAKDFQISMPIIQNSPSYTVEIFGMPTKSRIFMLFVVKIKSREASPIIIVSRKS